MTRKILLIQRQSPGDVLSMSRAVSDLKMTYPEFDIDVDCPCPEVWENNPHLTKFNRNDSDIERYEITYDDINQSGFTGIHFTDAFRNDISKKIGVAIIRHGTTPELWISDEEKGWINQVETDFGWHGPFWLINAGHKQDNELKRYHRWQKVVDLFNHHFRGSVRLVQIGHKDHVHPQLSDVYNLVGKTDLRQLIRLAWWAHGTIGPLSLQFVISAALRQPHVVVAAGKEGVRWHIYPFGRYLYTNGALACCESDGCWKGGSNGKCSDLLYGKPRCFSLISPSLIVDMVKWYYQGGRLGLDRGK